VCDYESSAGAEINKSETRNFFLMKKIIVIIFCLAFLKTIGQTEKPAFDGHTWEAPYTLGFPKGWDVERFLIPIEFAPSIPYKGVEDIRFTPGWGNAKSNEYWSYAFLWYLEGKPAFSAEAVANNLKAYYTGLIGRNIEPRKIPAEKLFPVKTEISAAGAGSGDIMTFKGTVYMLDYMEQQPIILNCIVHIRTCPGKNNTFVFTEISPKPYTDNVWQGLNELWTGFSCDKAAEKK
jgi:hypothetical protein